MKTRSAKAKGQRAAKELREELLKTFPELKDDDIKVVPGGVPGEDLWLSPAARSAIPYSFEVKNVERLNFWDAIKQAEDNSGDYEPVVAFKRNREPMRVIISISKFLELINEKTT